MSVTAAEFKMNVNKYLLMAATEDVYILCDDGRTVAKLSAPYKNKLDIVEALCGSVPDDVSFEEAMEERYNRL